MPVKQRSKLDPKKFHGFLLRFTRGNTPEDVNDAFCEALEYCDELGLPFADMAKNVYGDGDKAAELQSEVRHLLSQLSIEKAINEETALFRKGAKFCKGCCRKRHVIAAIIAVELAGAWIFAAHVKTWAFWWAGAAILALPNVYVWARFHWVVFADKVSWKSLRDNELARAIEDKWRTL